MKGKRRERHLSSRKRHLGRFVIRNLPDPSHSVSDREHVASDINRTRYYTREIRIVKP